MSIKVIAFDLFGTVFDAESASSPDRDHYTTCLRMWRQNRTYYPVQFIDSFQFLKPFADSIEGLNAIRAKGYKIVAASNIPAGFAYAASTNAGIEWDGILELVSYRIYKPDLAAYAAICDLMKCEPSEVLMVTGNHGKYGIGDDTEPLKIGMQTAKIRRDSPIQTIIDLAAKLKDGDVIQ
jgi:HAD superfamily hydrolase (TIGR01493 family)